MKTDAFIDLHCHLDGSLSVAAIRQILPPEELPASDEALLTKLRAPDPCRDLTEYLTRFDLPLRGLQTREHLRTAAMDLIQNAAKDPVRYLEIRFAPLLSTAALSCPEVIEAVLAGAGEAGKKYGVSFNLILCAMRHHAFEQNLVLLRAARDFLGRGVCALDLAGDENKFPTKLHVPFFEKAKAMGFPFTIHSGEQGGVENVRLALQLGARRLGHGIALIKDPNLMDLAKARRVGIELCPTSNFQTGAVKDAACYPLREFLERGLLATVNTDNRTVSDTDCRKELALAESLAGSVFENLGERLWKNAVVTSFADDSLKNRLLKEREQ
ncbi:MAG: adenosine deaminase [Fusobacteriaceae bacterium]|jgi:adenosine deaminase|nr:adenosine deaminase [Fusobacteriaceae bacterium]